MIIIVMNYGKVLSWLAKSCPYGAEMSRGDCGPLDLPICPELQCCVLQDFYASSSPRQCQLWNSSWSIACQGRKAKGSTWLNAPACPCWLVSGEPWLLSSFLKSWHTTWRVLETFCAFFCDVVLCWHISFCYVVLSCVTCHSSTIMFCRILLYHIDYIGIMRYN